MHLPFSVYKYYFSFYLFLNNSSWLAFSLILLGVLLRVSKTNNFVIFLGFLIPLSIVYTKNAENRCNLGCAGDGIDKQCLPDSRKYTTSSETLCKSRNVEPHPGTAETANFDQWRVHSKTVGKFWDLIVQQVVFRALSKTVSSTPRADFQSK